MSSTRLFRAFAWLLRRLAGRDSADAVLGDLLEEWHHSRSRIRFVWTLRPSLSATGPPGSTRPASSLGDNTTW